MKIYIATPTLSSEVRIALTRNEFIKIVDAGNDVMFEYRGKKFSIVMTECGADIAEQKKRVPTVNPSKVQHSYSISIRLMALLLQTLCQSASLRLSVKADTKYRGTIAK